MIHLTSNLTVFGLHTEDNLSIVFDFSDLAFKQK